jgi:hypothetical protein
MNRSAPECVVAALLITFAGVSAAARGDTRLARETPAVWNVTPDSAVIAWFTSGDEATAELEYGSTLAYGSTARATSRIWPLLQSGDRLRQHSVTLTGLTPAAKYFYRVRAGKQSLTPTSGVTDADFHFITAPEPGDNGAVHFLVMGDGGEGNKYQRAITYQMEQAPHEFLVHTGDVVYDNGTDAEWSLNYYPVYRNLIRNRPWFLSLGNHEYLGSGVYYVVGAEYATKGERLMTEDAFLAAAEKDPNPLVFKSQKEGTAEAYLENAFLPERPGRERYYSFDWGAVHVAMLDSNRSRTPGEPGDPQYQWLETDLKASKAPWKVVAFHHPMTSIGKPAYLFSVEGVTDWRKDWHPLFERYGVDVVFAGHDHTYQRSMPIVVDPETGAIARDDARGVTHVITGGGGGGITPQSLFPAPLWHSGVYHMRHHFLRVTADADAMTITAVGDADVNIKGLSERQVVGGPSETLDTVTLKRRPAPVR